VLVQALTHLGLIDACATDLCLKDKGP